MGKAEFKQLAIAALFLGIILVPMVGYHTPVFDGERALKLWAATFLLAALGIIGSGIRKRRAVYGEERVSAWAAQKQRWATKLRGVPTRRYLIALAVLLLGYPLVANNYMIDVSIICLIYITLGMGLNITVGLAGLLDMGYVAFYAVGAYTYSLLNLSFGLGFWTCLPICMALGAGAATLIGYPTLKARIRGDFLAIVTLGFGEIVRLVLNNWDSLTAGPDGLMGMAKPGLVYPALAGGALRLAEYPFDSLVTLYFLILLFAVAITIAVRRLNNSRIGRAWVAIREDETAAELCGVPTTAMKLLAYSLGGSFAAVGGAFFAAKLSFTNPSFFNLMESCVILSIVVLGGSGSIPGVIIAGVLLIAIPEVFRDFQAYRMLAFGAAMAFMMIIRPEGLIPASRKKAELHEAEACDTGDLEPEKANDR